MLDAGDGLRRCGACGESKPLGEFNWRRKGRNLRDNMCRPCWSAYKRQHYLANKERYVEQAAINQRRLRLERTHYLLGFFDTHPCVDCGETDPVVLEFDHQRDKHFNIGSALPYRNWQSILDEIEKCDVVCANCHGRRTKLREHSIRIELTGDPVERATGLEPASFSLEG